MIDLTKKIQDIQQSPDADKYSEEGIERLKEQLKNYEGEDKLVWWDEIRERLKNQPIKPLHKTGITSLDNVIGGFREKQLIIIAGDSGHGKSLIGMNLLHCMKELNPVMIPLEQSAEELIEQRMGNNFEVPNILSPDNLATAVTTAWIEERVVEGISKYNTKLVLIDHLGYIDNLGENGKNKRENLAYRVGEVMRELKGIAKRWNVIVLVLVHISQHDESNPPSRKDIKNSSDVIQESDIGMFIWRKNSLQKKIRVYDDKTLLSVQKNRRTGKNETIGLSFDSTTGWFKEDNDWVEAMEKSAQMAVKAEDEQENWDF